jgi:hypothetical protein
MKYINMHEAAFDQVSVAFPGLGNCHGIVLATKTGLLGYHMAGNSNEQRVDAFSMFADLFPNAVADGIALYGLCPTNRFNTDGSHKVELKSVADAIGFKGPIKGYRWDMAKKGWITTYVEVQFNGGVPSCSIESFAHDGGTVGTNPDLVNQKALTYYLATNPDAKMARLTAAKEVVISVKRSGTPEAVVPYKL